MKIVFGLLVLCFGVSEGLRLIECRYGEFPCEDGSCIDILKWCDASLDCEDDSDELYCNERSGSIVKNINHCNEDHYFLCNNGPCIPLVGRCDGLNSCLDGSDEEDCISNKTSSLPAAKLEVTRLSQTTENIRYLEKDWLQADSANKDTGHIEFIDAVNHPEIHKTNLPVLDDMDLQHVDIHDDILERQLSQTTNLDELHYTSDHTAATENFTVAPASTNQSETSKPDRVDDSFLNFTVKHEEKLNRTFEVNSALANKSNELVHPNNGSGSTSSIKDQKLNMQQAEIAVSQADSITSGNVEVKFEQGFTELNSRQYRKARSTAFRWLYEIHNPDFDWGDDSARAIIALHMADDDSLSKHPNEKMLMLKQLHLKLFAALMRNQTNVLSLGDLALYINALSASCGNPRNFYGQDLVKILRYRTNTAQGASKFVTPLVYMTLCLNNATSYEDLRKLQEMLYGSNKIDKVDLVAVTSLASTCMSRSEKFAGYGLGQKVAKTLYHKIVDEGLPENIYEVSLVSQALNEARIHQDLWNRSDALHHILDSQQSDGSFGDILASYYAIPVLKGKSLLSLNQHCHRSEKLALAPLEVLKNGKGEKRYVHYSLYFGNPVEVSQSLMMKVQKTTNFLDIMRIAETINPLYKFQYDMSKGKPYVYSIGGVVNDAERGLYWTLHVSAKQNYTDKNLVPYEGDIRSFIPSEGEYIVYWMKPIFGLL